MSRLTDGERDILREQEQDVRGLEPAVPSLGDHFREWLFACGAYDTAAAELREAEQAEKTRRYTRDQLAVRLVRAMIAAGHSGHGFARIGGYVVRINGSGHDRYAELVPAVEMPV